MNRCLNPLKAPLVWLAQVSILIAAWAATPASAQPLQPQRIPPISAKALPGTLRIVQPPEVLLDGKPARLAPGARIRDRNNLLVVSGSLPSGDLPVRYTLDYLGLVHEVWVLTDAEVAGYAPAPVQLAPY